MDAMKATGEYVQKNLKSLFDEFFGEKIDHPLIARVLAFSVDYIIAYSLPLFLFTKLSESDIFIPYPLYVFVLFSLIYFTIGNSKIFKGQTPGKYLLRIRVVNELGKPIGLIPAFVRSAFIVTMIYTNTILENEIYEDHHISETTIIILMIVYSGQTYFPLFKTDRQGLHDILARSFVVPSRRVVITNIVFNRWLFFIFLIITTLLITYLHVVVY
jgi:uncharacterized RDD family membrane protein YckC